MNHVSQEDLVLCYYGDPSAAEARAHAAECAECGHELTRLGAILDRVQPLDGEEAPAGYEAAVWRRLEWRLRTEKRRSGHAWLRWLAAAAVIVAAFGAGLLWKRTATVSEPAITAEADAGSSGATGRDRILLVVVGDHIDRSERILVELTNLEPGEETDISAKQARVEELLASNRIYRRTANDRGEDSVATLLDELEPVLVQIANGPSRLTAGELRSIQKRVETKGLVFKLRVVRDGVRATAEPALGGPSV